MRNLMHAHGLHVENLDCTGWEQSLCYRVLHGLCAGIPIDSNLKRNACDDIAGSCSSAKQLQLLIMDLLINKLAPKMSLKPFHRLCTSIDIPESTFLPRKDLILQLQTRCHSLENTMHQENQKNT